MRPNQMQGELILSREESCGKAYLRSPHPWRWPLAFQGPGHVTEDEQTQYTGWRSGDEEPEMGR